MSDDCRAYLNPVAHLESIAHVSARLLGIPVHIEHSVSEKFTVLRVPSLSYLPTAHNSQGLPAIIEISCANTNEPWQKDDKNYYSKYKGEAYHISIHLQANSKGELLFYNRASPIMQALAHKLVDIFGGTLYATDKNWYAKKITHQVKKGTFLPFYVDDEYEGDEGFVAKHIFYQQTQAIPSSLIRYYQNISPYPYTPDELQQKLYRFVDIEYQNLTHSVNQSLETLDTNNTRQVEATTHPVRLNKI
jgi:hypothetical protein